MKRREYLGGIGGLGALSLGGKLDEGIRSLASSSATDGHHPGPPRFIHAGEKLVDPLAVSYRGDGSPDGRNTLAPRIPDPERDPVNYGDDAFAWRVVETPADSGVAGFYEDPEEYDYGDGVVEFDPDVPGTYGLELDAPDGTHRLTVRVFPEPSDDAAGPPRLRAEGRYDPKTKSFVVETDPDAAPDSEATAEDVDVEFLPDDRASLTADAVTVDGTTARIPADAVDGTARIHAVPVADRHGVSVTVELDADDRSARSLNAVPDWLPNSVGYEIFTRSFGTGPGEVDFGYLSDRVDYLDELGLDWVWLTPVLEATSHQNPDSPGGPHGYDTTDFFDTADALGSVAEYEAFVDACHDRDIKVVFDLVFNHTAAEHRFYRQASSAGTDSKYYEWYERTADGEPYSFFGWSDLINVAYETPALREHMLSVVDFWAEKVDGFRCDVAYGVPHDFWAEVRTRVKEANPDAMLLDEVIPYEAEFGGDEFDMHFDDWLVNTLRSIGQGGTPADALRSTVTHRQNEGFPDRDLFLQYVENHDMRRYLDVADRSAQRAAAAATFTLPGVPMVYYGQERALTNYSEPRIDEKGHFRAFMNWDEYDQEHLEFYRSLVDARHDLPALRESAELTGVYYETDSEDVVAYGRDAGEERAVVVLNFGSEPAEVTLRGAVDGTDLIENRPPRASERGEERGRGVAKAGERSNADVQCRPDNSGDDAEPTTVTVDSVGVFAADSLSGLGEEVASLDDPAGDDHGPGSYTYPTDDVFADGAFDLTGLSLHETPDAYQLRVTVDAPIENAWDLDHGFSLQHLQFYLRDPDATGGATAAREGVNATLSQPYHRRVVADGERGARVEGPDGEALADGDVFVSPSTRSIRVDVPKSAIDGSLTSWQVAPLLLGYDPEGAGGVRQVNESNAARYFGGGTGDASRMGTDPNVIDAVVPSGTSQAEALGYTGSETATIPYATFAEGLYGTLLERWDDPTGDGHGPGSYTAPTADPFYDGAFDLASFGVYEDGDRYTFTMEIAGGVENPWGLANGYSLQFPQVYVRDPSADSGDTAAREGVNATFDSPYQYRLVAPPETKETGGLPIRTAVETSDGSVVTDDVVVYTVEAQDTIAASVPKSAFDGRLGEMELVPLLLGYDGYGLGGVRRVNATRDQYRFGGGSGDDSTLGSDPQVIDLVTPRGTSQGDALSYSASSRASIPYLSMDGLNGTLLKRWEDPAGDDHGPGSYTYPTNATFDDGTFDLTGVELYEDDGRYQFVYYLDTSVVNPWSGPNGFSFQTMQIYLRDPSADGTVPSTTTAREGVWAEFEAPYHYRVWAEGWRARIEDANGESVASEAVSAAAYADRDAIAVSFPKETIGDVTEMETMPLLLGQSGSDPGRIRPVAASASKWRFGGGRDDRMDPNIIDMVAPEGTTQANALSYSANERAVLPFLSAPAGGEDSE
ncbi:DUF3459 domain-containing protein [Halomicroarcula limicola]|uniref:DUF3459 domain-containing protein n=1 Tax=Haloarcula limicola TaxID=1429915 RepID=A0A8J7YEM4_9EURY|nr:glucodextranase DOMON-like domain-containing protein [Halomicroarcula limicola]MBV0925836.1 DUF3459 domain-containing protein [Halomicroarcula limicola]